MLSFLGDCDLGLDRSGVEVTQTYNQELPERLVLLGV